MATQKVIHVGIGTFGKRWCREFLRANVDDGTVEVVALVDVDPAALAYGRSVLNLPESACFTDPRAAFAAVKADLCTVVVPPNYHEAIVDIAIEHRVDVLSEKPIADTMAGSVRIARKIRQAGRKMAVTMSHRFDQDKTTLRRVVRSGKLGRVSTVSCRYQADIRQHMAWGALFRHTMADPMLIEGAIHHLDIVADLAGGRCDTLLGSRLLIHDRTVHMRPHADRHHAHGKPGPSVLHEFHPDTRPIRDRHVAADRIGQTPDQAVAKRVLAALQLWGAGRKFLKGEVGNTGRNLQAAAVRYDREHALIRAALSRLVHVTPSMVVTTPPAGSSSKTPPAARPSPARPRPPRPRAPSA